MKAVKDLRVLYGMSQKAMGLYLGMERRSYSYFEEENLPLPHEAQQKFQALQTLLASLSEQSLPPQPELDWKVEANQRKLRKIISRNKALLLKHRKRLEDMQREYALWRIKWEATQTLVAACPNEDTYQKICLVENLAELNKAVERISPEVQFLLLFRIDALQYELEKARKTLRI